MSKPRPADPVITSAGHTVAVEAAGRTYVLRAPTFGEYGQMVARAVTQAAPSDAIFADALRTAARRDGGDDAADMVAAIDAHEEARDYLDSLYAAHGADRAAWDADAKREIADGERGLMAATRRRNRVEWRLREAPEIIDLRRYQLDAQQQERLALVVLCVATVDGEFTTLTEADAQALPAQAVLAIAERAAALLRPTPAAEKN